MKTERYESILSESAEVPTQCEVIIEAFQALGGTRRKDEIQYWATKKYGHIWKDFGTRMADMVPQRLGGNPSSNVPDHYRVLRRVGSGQYRLITEKVRQEPEFSNNRENVMSSLDNSEENAQNNLQPNLYHIKTGKNLVEVWSAVRLPFEPKGWLRQLRSDICSALGGIRCDSGKFLHAAYVSTVDEACDVENILFYNVGVGCFVRSYDAGLRFERVFHQPPAPPSPMHRSTQHYHRYETVAKETGFMHWVPAETLVRWNAQIPKWSLTSSLKASEIWYRMKRGSIEVVKKPHKVPAQFGVGMTIHAPRYIVRNLAALLKPLLDGAVAAFHQHDGTMQREVADRLAHALEVPYAEVVHYLNESTYAVLGRRRLLWPWGDSIQWNPADECCVAGELLESPANDSVELSGELYEVREKPLSKLEKTELEAKMILREFVKIVLDTAIFCLT